MADTGDGNGVGIEAGSKGVGSGGADEATTGADSVDMKDNVSRLVLVLYVELKAT